MPASALSSRRGRSQRASSISTRLVRVFVVVIAMAGVAAGIGAYQLHVGAKRTTEMYARGVQGTEILRDANSRMFEAAHSHYEASFVASAKDYRDLQQEASDKRDEAIGSLREYEPLAPTSQLGAVNAQIARFQKIKRLRAAMMTRFASLRGKGATAAEVAAVEQIEGVIDQVDTAADSIVTA